MNNQYCMKESYKDVKTSKDVKVDHHIHNTSNFFYIETFLSLIVVYFFYTPA